jgi:putative spermidine/putrescine transport system substrate-binding protein
MTKATTLSRRSVLKGATATAAFAAGTTLGAPMIWAQNIKDITLRQFGTGVSNLNDVADKVKEDLGFTLEMTALDTDSVTQRAATQPNSFDIADIEYFICKKVWAAGNLQAMDTSKIKNYDKIVGIFRNGLLTPTSTIAQGTAPHTVGFTSGPNGTDFVQEESGWMTLIPTIYNADTLGIRPDLIGRPITKWSELLNPEFKGKASILDISSIGIMDMAMVVESMGEYKYPDKGNMTREEIDMTLGIFTEAKKNGQFRAFWKSFDESVNLMASGEVVIQSMWSPAITAVKSRGIECVYQPLEEGYRSWGGGIGLSKSLTGLERDAAYEYINWYLDGWVGGYLMRQGYYSAVPETSKAFMSENEWGYWFEGKPATDVITSPQGDPLAQAGDVRDGGSFEERMGSVACWNSVMEENQYMVRKWNEFIAASRVSLLARAAPKSRGAVMQARPNLTGWLMVSPLAIVLAVFLVLPIILIGVVSFWTATEFSIVPAFSWENYDFLFGSPVTYSVFLNTFKYAIITWALTFTIGFTVAYYLAFHIRTQTWQIALFLLCTIPFWTSNIIRMISWIPFLGRNGIANSALISWGVVDEPLDWLLFSDFAVILAFVHLYTLFMVVPIFNTMMRIDKSLIEAARDAGASGRQILWNVILPLTKSGIMIGTIFVVTLVMGDFITVRFMSGSQSANVGRLISNDIALLQYPSASATAIVLLATVLITIAILLRFVDIRKEL